MRPKERRESGEQDLFRSRLDQINDLDHALVKLARAIDWRFGHLSQEHPLNLAAGSLCQRPCHIRQLLFRAVRVVERGRV